MLVFKNRIPVKQDLLNHIQRCFCLIKEIVIIFKSICLVSSRAVVAVKIPEC